MSRSTKNITISVTPDEYDEINQEARADDPTNSITAFVKAIVMGRQDMAIQVNPDVEKVKLVMQTRIDGLEKENAKLLDKLTDVKSSMGLGALNQKADKLAERDTDIEARIRKEFETQLEQTRIANLTEQHRLLVEKHKEIEAELEEVRETLGTYEKIEKYATLGTTLAGNLLGSSPALQHRIANSGLGRLVFGGGDGQETASLTTEQQADLGVGMAIRNDFPGDDRVTILTILRFMRDNRDVMHNITNSAPYRNFITRTQAQQQTQQAA